MPDVLVMTATPIPRTAAMTVYGDLDVSVLDELPPGRTPIVTKWADGPLLEAEVWADVRDQVADGRQAYVVCPLIDESEKLEVASAEETFERLTRRRARRARGSACCTAGCRSAEKEATMDSFRAGELDVLVATTVIEVGVDVPNATVMVILDADRFGIAQLHQLRGRVGRGAHASTCWLVTQQRNEPGDPVGNPRVEALVATTDGFELAEIDLDLRGEGTIMSHVAEGPQRPQARLAAPRPRPGRAGPGGGVRDRRRRPRPRRPSGLADELALLFSESDEAFLAKS